MIRPRLAALYVLFAGISTAVNIAAQWATTRLTTGSRYEIYLSIAVGTLAGLVVKYVLDKRWIFRYTTRSNVHDAKLFMVYSAMGGITTLIFWGTELAFQATFGSETMRYVGAVIGLGIGYIIKYRLDRRFVFIEQTR